MHLIKSWGFPVCHSFQLLLHCISCYTDVRLLWNTFGLCTLLTQPLSIAVVLDRLVPQVVPEFSGFCCIWKHLFSLFLTTKLLKELLLVCFEQLFLSGFIQLKPCRQSYKLLPYFFCGNTQSFLIDLAHSVKPVFLSFSSVSSSAIPAIC